MKKILTAFAALAILAFAGCDDDTDLTEVNQRIDDLEERMSVYEADIQGINDDIYALQTLVSNSGSISISSVSESDGVYTLVLSNGQTITINQNATSEVVMPEITINEDGYWTVNGEVLTVDGNPVPASGDAGETPVIGVDADGYWTVTYGDTTEQILDASGNPIKATSDAVEADSFFDSVTIENGYLVIVLKGGETSYSIPIVEGFQCIITTAADPVVFTSGETKTFAVTQSNVASAVVFAPTGWEASLTDTELSVTAPEASTKATADSKKDVSILAVSTTGFAAISKIHVEVDESSTEITVYPAATITAGDATQTSVSFTVALSDATAWYYMLLASDAEAPTAETLLAATEGSETTLTLEADANGAALADGTSYTLYVLPVNGETNGTIASASATTVAAVVYTSYYTKYNAGEDIVIAGVTYNVATNGTATLLTASEADVDLSSYLASGGICFLKSENGYKFTTTTQNIKGDVVFIGDDPDALTTIAPASANNMLISGSFVMYNINFEMSGFSNQFLNLRDTGTNVISKIHFDSCEITGMRSPFLWSGANTTSYVQSVKIVDSSIQFTTGANMFNFANSEDLTGMTELIFNNNIVYNSSPSAMLVFNYNKTTQQPSRWTNTTVEFTYNTFVNCPSSNGYLKLDSAGSLKYSNNIFYCDDSYTSTQSYLLYIVNADADFTGHTFQDNVAYGMGESSKWYQYHESSIKPEGFEGNEITKETTCPISTTYPFTAVSGYTDYGAQR